MQELEQLAQRAAAVALAVLLRRGQFGRSAAELGKEKERVVAEAVRAARRARDLAMPQAFGDQRTRIVRAAHEHHDAAVVRRALIAQSVEQPGVVARIALLATAFATRVVGGMHARLTAERVHAKAGTVGKRRQAGGPAPVPRPGAAGPHGW